MNWKHNLLPEKARNKLIAASTQGRVDNAITAVMQEYKEYFRKEALYDHNLVVAKRNTMRHVLKKAAASADGDL